MQLKRRNWSEMLPPLLVVLAVLLTVIACLYLLSVVLSILGHFYQTILLFVLGAIVAYLLTPLVTNSQRLLRKRWAAILSIYLGAFIGLILLGILLVTPFVQQGQELVKNLNTPTHASLSNVTAAYTEVARLPPELKAQRDALAAGSLVPLTVQHTQTQISALQVTLTDLEHPRPSPNGTAQVEVPPSYVMPLSRQLAVLEVDYAHATGAGGTPALMDRAVADAGKVSASMHATARKIAGTPILVLSLQSWFDRHNISVDINQRFGTAVQQLNAQVASLLNNAVTIATTTGNLLISAILILIISVYFVSDGPRIIRRGVGVFPASQQQEVWFYLRSLDQVLGNYIRGQIILAGIAGVLGGAGAAVLGVPYGVLIGVSTTVLALIPVIGPVILIVPPVIIALVFTSLPTTIILLVYFVVMMQVVTNVVGPRLLSSAVGIHPLEAMAAALMGFPIAGFLGAFFAVPIVGFVHVAVAEAYRHFHKGDAPPSTEPLAGVASKPAEATPVEKAAPRS
ncbi:MAG TPA: AI-2E family transporter [Chloroflexota bacterium]|nr:AI-2E family transporter [Chloroflexota bacterium]